MLKLVTIMTILSFSTIAHANLPEEIAGKFETEKPIGKEKFEVLFLDVYTSSFWSDSGKWDKSKPYAISNIYHMNFSTKELVDKTLEEMKRIDNVSDDALAAYKFKLETVFPNTKKGDRITAFYTPKEGTAFFHNGVKTGVIENEAFAVPFFNIWLSDKSMKPKLSRKLRGE